MSDELEGLWGEEFALPKEKQKTKEIINKISKPREPKENQKTVTKQLQSKKISLDERLEMITAEVLRVLGKQKENVLVIKSKEDLHNYISDCITAGRIAIDTETNNSLDPITCKLMGPCFYAPGLKQAYVPVNHQDPHTQERLTWQCTEQDIKEELQRIVDSKIPIIMHNGKFDYQVLKCTCGIEVVPDYDTLIDHKLINENEVNSGLKALYVKYIDPEQEKYNIEKLFAGVEYADVDPDIFALYAATDSMETDKIFEYEQKILTSKEYTQVRSLEENLENPLVRVAGEMELAGMYVDQEYAKLLSAKYHNILDTIDDQLNSELEKLKPQIDAWRLTPEANIKAKKKSGEDGGKSKNEQLTDPINLASPTQLAILFYDILKAPQVNKKSPRGTGEDELKAIAQKLSLPIFGLILKRREIVKLLTTYIDVIPELAKRWPDGRVRTHFNAYGAATGRFSSSDPINFQNVPSGNKEIRMLFCAQTRYHDVLENDNCFEVAECDEISTESGWKSVTSIRVGDCILLDDTDTQEVITIKRIEKKNNNYLLYI